MKQEKAKLLVLGSFHMAEYEGLDSEKRQREIEELVSKLEKFNPTKIAVEMVPEDSESFNEEFIKYKQGTYKLPINEIYQVAFRLGLKLEHEQIYPTDWMGDADMGYGEVVNWAEENQPELLKEIYEELVAPELSEDESVLDWYKELNAPTIINKVHKHHLNIARIGDCTTNYIGMNWLSWWYKRNLIMFANLTRLIDSEEERILFLVGVGHSSIVTNFIEESEFCEVVQPLSYLS